MLFICDFCNTRKKEMIKLPNAFEVNTDYILFPIQPKQRYTNICLECIGIQREDPFI